MMGGGRGGGVGGRQRGLHGIAFHDFSVAGSGGGVPGLGASSVPRPLTLLLGGKEISTRQGRGEN